MPRAALNAFFVLAAAMLSGCVPTFDDELSTVTESKLLAITSEPAEAAPGDPVTLSALVATPTGDMTPPRLTWGLCLARKPLTELGPVNPVCLQPPGSQPSDVLTPLGTADSVPATVPMDACRLFGPSLPDAMNGQPAGRPVDPDPTGGFYQPVTVTLAETNVTSLGDVRIFCPPSGLDQDQAADFNANYRLNQNPVVDSVALVDDSGNQTPIADTVSVAQGQTVHFSASWAACPTSAVCGDGVCSALEDKTSCAGDCTTPKGCTGAEQYAYWNPDSRELETQHESLRVSWFATAGKFGDPVTGRDETEFAQTSTENSWTAPSEAAEVTLWLVIRDARGGQTFRSFTVSVEP